MRLAVPHLGPCLRRFRRFQLVDRSSFLIIIDLLQTPPLNQSFALLSLGTPLNIFGEALAVSCGANVHFGSLLLVRPCSPSFLFSAFCDWRQLNPFRDIENDILKLQALISKSPRDIGQPPLDRWFQFPLRCLDLHQRLLRFEARLFLLLLPTFIILFNYRLPPPQSFNILVLDWVLQQY